MTGVHCELVSMDNRYDLFQQVRLTGMGRMLEQCRQKKAQDQKLVLRAEGL